MVAVVLGDQKQREHPDPRSRQHAGAHHARHPRGRRPGPRAARHDVEIAVQRPEQGRPEPALRAGQTGQQEHRQREQRQAAHQCCARAGVKLTFESRSQIPIPAVDEVETHRDSDHGADGAARDRISDRPSNHKASPGEDYQGREQKNPRRRSRCDRLSCHVNTSFGRALGNRREVCQNARACDNRESLSQSPQSRIPGRILMVDGHAAGRLCVTSSDTPRKRPTACKWRSFRISSV